MGVSVIALVDRYVWAAAVAAESTGRWDKALHNPLLVATQ